MDIELYFSKSDNSTPWGFRLTGGSDCDIPLRVIKVTEGSIADKAGLQTGDVIVRINGHPTIGLTHAEAHDVLLAAGQEFLVAIRRGDPIDFAQDDERNNEEVCNILDESSQKQLSAILELKRVHDENCGEKDLPQRNSKLSITDEKIAEAISGEAELLPDQNVLGVNFNKVDLTESTVLKVIKEETADTKVELQNKKWSTFLQKPKNPKVIPKKKESEEPTAPPYRVIIKKQKKKDAETTSQVTEASSTLTRESVNEMDNEECGSTDDFEDRNAVEEREEAELELQREQELDEEITREKICDIEVRACSEEQTGICSEVKATETVTSDSSLSVEEQLAQVQHQLQALAQLPSAIQVTLDAVTQQLAKIVRATHKRGEEEITAAQSVSSEDETTEQVTEEIAITAGEVTEASDAEDDANLEKKDLSSISEEDIKEEMQTDEEIEADLKTPENMSEVDSAEHLSEGEQETSQVENEKAVQQERKTIQLEEFHQRRLEQRPTYPLTPLQRPIVLPGGRKWAQPEDALPVPRKPKMTDEKICKTIETYSEVITGRLKGLTSGIPYGRGLTQQNQFTGIVPYTSHMGVRINFLKYQPPPRNLDYLQHSEVFRLVHDVDPPRRGIAARPDKIVSEQDYYSQRHYQSDQKTQVEV